MSREAGAAVAQVRAVRQRNARGAVETRSRTTSADVAGGRVDVGAAPTGEAGRAEAREVGDQIAARAAVQTRRAGAVVGVRLAQDADETDVAIASEVVDGVDASRAVEARTGATVVNVTLTQRALVASRTHTAESVHRVHAPTT